MRLPFTLDVATDTASFPTFTPTIWRTGDWTTCPGVTATSSLGGPCRSTPEARGTVISLASQPPA